MTQLWKCDICGKTFLKKEDCEFHEIAHDDCDLETRIRLKCKNKKLDLCDYCDHVYYVYGCEKDCEVRNKCTYARNYPYFKPSEKLKDDLNSDD